MTSINPFVQTSTATTTSDTDTLLATLAGRYKAAGATPVVSKAERDAKAAFDTPAATPPWQQATATTTTPSQIASLLTARSLDTNIGRTGSNPDTALAASAWSILSSLKTLATAASKTGDVAAIGKRFAAGLGELSALVDGATGDHLRLSFGKTVVTARTQPVAVPQPVTVGAALAAGRFDTLDTVPAAVTLDASSYGKARSLTVDLAGADTLDAVAARLNAALAADPPAGEPRLYSRFAVVKGDAGWALQRTTADGERLGFANAAAPDRVLVSAALAQAGAGSRLAAFTAGDAAPATVDLAAALGKDGAFTVNAAAGDGAGGAILAGQASGASAGESRRGTDIEAVRLDASGRVVWTRSLGAADASASAVAGTADGGALVAGTVTRWQTGGGAAGGNVVVRYDGDGNEAALTTLPPSAGDSISAVAAASDGGLWTLGQSAGPATVLTRLDAGGHVLAQRSLAGSAGTFLLGGDGAPMVADVEGGHVLLHRLAADTLQDAAVTDLGEGHAPRLAVADNGDVAVAFETADGGQAAQVDASGGIVWRQVVAAAGDSVDGVAFAGGAAQVAVRAAGSGQATLVTASAGGVTRQALGPATPAGPLAIAAVRSSAAEALGFGGGEALAGSATLVAGTGLRPGDHFSVTAGGKTSTLTIAADDTMATLATRLRRAVAGSGQVFASTSGGKAGLSLSANDGQSIVLADDGGGTLARLGLSPGRVEPVHIRGPHEALVTPGGTFDLGLDALAAVTDRKSAAAALPPLDTAIATVQRAWRSLFWDDTKAAVVRGDSQSAGHVSAYLSAQAARYQDALNRLSGL